MYLLEYIRQNLSHHQLRFLQISPLNQLRCNMTGSYVIFMDCLGHQASVSCANIVLLWSKFNQYIHFIVIQNVSIMTPSQVVAFSVRLWPSIEEQQVLLVCDLMLEWKIIWVPFY